ncbi:galactose mutarotase-like protein, partial [Rozella allomycis CSF55]
MPFEIKKLENGNIDSVKISIGQSYCNIHIFGATITHCTLQNRTILFLSDKALFDKSKPIRGAQFGKGKIPTQHGFARNIDWTWSKNVNECKDYIETSFELTDNETTRKLWPHSFKLTYHVVLFEDKLTTRTRVQNTGDSVFEFQTLFHTYFYTSDIANVRVKGLKGASFCDDLTRQNGVENNEAITFGKEVDCRYYSIPKSLHLETGDFDITLQLNGFSDVVVWNPWIQKSKTMADFGDESVISNTPPVNNENHDIGDDGSGNDGPVSSFQSLQAEGDLLAKQGDPRKAVEAFTKNCLVSRAKCHLQLGDPKAALSDAEASLKEDKDFFKEYQLKPIHSQRSDSYTMSTPFITPSALKTNDKKSMARATVIDVKKSVAQLKVVDTALQAKREANEKQLLGELYADKEYLQKLADDPDFAPNDSLSDLINEGLQYLESRTEFWRQQKPIYARKTETKRIHEKLNRSKQSDSPRRSESAISSQKGKSALNEIEMSKKVPLPGDKTYLEVKDTMNDHRK